MYFTDDDGTTTQTLNEGTGGNAYEEREVDHSGGPHVFRSLSDRWSAMWVSEGRGNNIGASETRVSFVLGLAPVRVRLDVDELDGDDVRSRLDDGTQHVLRKTSVPSHDVHPRHVICVN